jgi:hypothetical protein
LTNNAKIIITKEGINPTLLLGNLPVSVAPEPAPRPAPKKEMQ